MRRTKIDEGFWDSIANSIKTLALDSVAEYSSSAKGKAQALKLATGMYNSYKEYLGKIGAFAPSPATIQSFFATHTGNSFGKHAGEEFSKFAGLSLPKDDRTSNTDDQESGVNLAFTETPEFKNFVKHCGINKFANMVAIKDYTYSREPDGSIIQVPKGKEAVVKKLLESKDPKTMRVMYEQGFLTTWANFKTKNRGNYDTDSERMVFAKNSLMAASDLVGKNFSKVFNRFIIAAPKGDAEFQLVEGLLVEMISDSDLRKFMVQMANDAFRLGVSIGSNNEHLDKTSTEPSTSSSTTKEPEVKKEPAKAESKPAIDLTSDEKDVVNAVDRDVGIENLIKSSNPEVERIVKKIVTQAVKSFKDEIKKK